MNKRFIFAVPTMGLLVAGPVSAQRVHYLAVEEIEQALLSRDREREVFAESEVVATALGSLSPRSDSIVDVLSGLLGSPDVGIRVKGVIYLGRFASAGHGAALEHLLAYWESASPGDARPVLMVAGSLPDDRRVIGKLVDTMLSLEPEQRDNAARAVQAPRISGRGTRGAQTRSRITPTDGATASMSLELRQP